MDDGLDKALFGDDDEDDFYDFDFDKRRNPHKRYESSYSLIENANGDIDCSGDDGIFLVSNFSLSCEARKAS